MENATEKKSTRGGARPGAGRKKTEGLRHMFTIPADVADWIKQHGGGEYLPTLIFYRAQSLSFYRAGESSKID